MLNNDNWTRINGDGINAPTYWGYSMSYVASGETGWAIRRLVDAGSDQVIEFANNCGTFENKWTERLACFQTPYTAPIVTFTATTISSINFQWSPISGVSRYYVTVVEDGKVESLGGWNETLLTNITAVNISLLPSNTKYNIKIIAKNRAGSTTTEFSLTTN